jgi:deazaflavin-dependent oxidoreductase (nitroreductase family)
MPLLASPVGAWLVRHVARPIDLVLLPLSRGRFSFAAIFYPTLLLTTIGARSGQRRQAPLVFLPDGDRIILIASNYGGTRHPAWYHNLRANPVAEVLLRGRTRRFIAHEAQGIERAELWARAVAYYPGYHSYQGRTDGRLIPIMVLTPHP